MLGAMLFSIFVGFPISFTLIFLAFVFGSWGAGSALTFFLQTLQTNAVMLDDQLVAVPLFTFMGIMMEQAGLMERLFRAVQLMMSKTRGALYIAVLFVSMIFAAATGIVGASVTILGIMAGRTMIKSGYNTKLSAGAITAGGTLGILIPPSIMLIVMGPVLEVPVTDLFRAAIVPGIHAGRCCTCSMRWAAVWINPRTSGRSCRRTSSRKPRHYYLALRSRWLVFAHGHAGLAAGRRWRERRTWRDLPAGGLCVLPVAWVGVMYLACINWSRKARPGGFLLLGPLVRVLHGPGPADGADRLCAGLNPRRLGHPGRGVRHAARWGRCCCRSGVPQADAAGRFYEALIKTLELTVLVMFLVAASNFFGAVFSNLGTPKMLTEVLLSWDLSTTLQC